MLGNMVYFKCQKAFHYRILILFSNYPLLQSNFWDASITIKIEELKRLKISISQVASVHALILIIKIRFLPLSTMLGFLNEVLHINGNPT